MGGAALAAAVLLGLLAAGCDNTGGPPRDPAETRFSFLPAPDSLAVNSSAYLDFQVASSPAVTFNVTWTLDGQPVAVGKSFRFFPPDLGPMVLQAHAVYEEFSADRRWDLDVTNTHPLAFSYDPPEADQQLIEGEHRRFQVRHQWPFTVSFSWIQAGRVVGTDSLYDYTAGIPGPDSLRVDVTADGQVLGQAWRLAVDPYRPPEVTQVLAVDGPTGGSAEVVWQATAPVVYPVDGYEVAVSFAGPITEGNWDQALHLGRFPHTQDFAWMRRTFTEAEHGLVPGAQGWFAVRSGDDQGNLSPVNANAGLSISLSWWAAGLVVDELGVPVAGALVQDDLQLFSEVTDAEGWYRIGPFADHQTVRLRTITPDGGDPEQVGTAWHDYRTGDLTTGGDITLPLDFRLITSYGTDPGCPDYGGSFLTYFRYMTRTSFTTDLRPDQRLYKWDHYPLTVHIPQYLGEGGLDFRASAALTLDIWNDSMGEDYFVLTDSEEAADVVFVFGDDGDLANGATSLVLPGDLNWQLGDTVPQKMQVYVHNTLDDAQRVQEVALHELGHVLGLYRHALCNNNGYLMYFVAAGALDNGPENAIHIDERRAVRTIRYLPQGWDMAPY